MSVEEILTELPKLNPVELQLVFQEILDLREKNVLVASPELLRAIEEADAEPLENSIDIDEVIRMFKTRRS